MAGTVDVVTRVFAGYCTENDLVVLDPQLPAGPVSAQFGLLHRGQRLQVRIDHDSVEVTADPRATNPRVRVRGGGRAATMTGVQAVAFTPRRV